MHIKFFCTNYYAPWGGSEELWSQTACRLKQMGVEVSVSVTAWEKTPQQVKNLKSQGISVWERRVLSPTRLQGWKWRLRISKPFDINFSTTIAWMRQGKPDLICFSDGSVVSFPHWRLHCKEMGIPYANLSQANAECCWPSDPDAELQIEALLHARKCYFVSKGNIHLLERQLGCLLGNTDVVRNPFNVDYDNKPTWPKMPSDGLKLACVARIEPNHKGQDLLFDVLALEKWRKRALSVSIFGKGKMEKSTKRLATLLGVEDMVHFCGYSENVEEIWNNHHALILPSRSEGLPLAGVEAMLCHRPVILTDVAGNSEIVQNGITGFLANHPSVSALDAALEQAWQNKSMLQQMGLAAGSEIRKLVPRDPVGEFAKKLLQVASHN